MKEQNRLWRVLALVVTAVVVGALLSLGPAAWATPEQRQAQQTTVPPVKTADKTTVYPGEQLVFEVVFSTGAAALGVTITDNVDPNIRVDSVTATPAPTTMTGPGVNPVVVTYNSLPAVTTVTVRIYCTVLASAPAPYEIVNVATVTAVEPPAEFSAETTVTVRVPFVPEPGTLLLVASGLAGLAGYAASRWHLPKEWPAPRKR